MNEQQNHSKDYFAQLLQDFSAKVEQEVSLIQQGVKIIKKQDESESVSGLKQQLMPVLEQIAQTGDASGYNWTHLRSLIVVKSRDVLQMMQVNYPYVKQPGLNEGFDDELDVILQFLCFFESKAPFTIQRICELLLAPEKHYRSSKKILFAMEKLVNVSQL